MDIWNVPLKDKNWVSTVKRIPLERLHFRYKVMARNYLKQNTHIQSTCPFIHSMEKLIARKFQSQTSLVATFWSCVQDFEGCSCLPRYKKGQNSKLFQFRDFWKGKLIGEVKEALGIKSTR